MSIRDVHWGLRADETSPQQGTGYLKTVARHRNPFYTQQSSIIPRNPTFFALQFYFYYFQSSLTGYTAASRPILVDPSWIIAAVDILFLEIHAIAFSYQSELLGSGDNVVLAAESSCRNDR